MNINICSRKEAETQIRNSFPLNTAVISFYDPPESGGDITDPVDYSDVCSRVFYVSVYDIDLSVLGDFGLTYEKYFPESPALAGFICRAFEDDMDILCQCEYGESRSSGCAAAIKEYFYHQGLDVFTDYRYYPNQLIYHKVYDALENYCFCNHISA
ncbi:MAG: hypothetical protein LUF32_08365 [Clostridiales bacterium]|nr:hypothetical protein [Clostridiales bacterium]